MTNEEFTRNQVADQFVNHFKKFFGTSVPVLPIEDGGMLFTKRLTKLEAGCIMRMVTDKDINDAMFGTRDNKAPGPDGSISGRSAKFSINVSEKSCGLFKGGRGLRQGDPVSNYLFTMVMEFYTLIMERNVRNTHEFNYHFGCKSLKATHILFDDDLLVFCHGDSRSVNLIETL
nr:RNA-directed DNA polymerase, eukaryota, reverse transcriptase zinc-binding domain protein [Tanacetum cinerariifolium]